MLALFLSLFVLAPAPAAAENDSWSSWYGSCQGVNLPVFREFVLEAKEWESDLSPLRAKMRHLSDITCQGFLGEGRHNSADHVRAYSAERDDVMALSLRQERHGLGNMKYLEDQFTGVDGFMRKFGVSFSGSPCGQGIVKKREYFAAKVKEIQAETRAANQKCIDAMAGPNPKTGFSKPGVARTAGQGAPGRMPASAPSGRSANGASDITGTEKKTSKLPVSK